MQWVRFIVIYFIFIFLLCSCRPSDKQLIKSKKSMIMTVQAKKEMSHLYFNGTLLPLNKVSLISPAEGHVTMVGFQYGDFVKKGALLLQIQSEKMAQSYQQIVTQFFQKKTALENNEQSFEGDKVLHKAGAISDEEFTNSLTAYETSKLDFYSSEVELKKILEKMHIHLTEIAKSSNLDNPVVKKIFSQRFVTIELLSPESGVVLFPSNDGQENSDGKLLQIGNLVTENQLLINIGDLSGFLLNIDVSETEVNRVYVGQAVNVTGVGFPGIVLNGEVISVARQAEAQSNHSDNTMPSTFLVGIKIPSVTAEQQKVVRLGMSVKIDLEIKSPFRIMVPFSAVTVTDQSATVMVLDPKSHQAHPVRVKIGETSVDEVEITEGLKPGDQIVVTSHD